MSIFCKQVDNGLSDERLMKILTMGDLIDERSLKENLDEISLKEKSIGEELELIETEELELIETEELELIETKTIFLSDSDKIQEPGDLLKKTIYYILDPIVGIPKEFSPWLNDGPVFKPFDETSLQKSIKQQYPICLFLTCYKEVYAKNIQYSLDPFDFCCREHQVEITNRYGFGSVFKM